MDLQAKEQSKQFKRKRGSRGQRKNHRQGHEKSAPPKLFIGGLHPFVVKSDLVKLFSPYIQLIMDGKEDKLDAYNPPITKANQKVIHRGQTHIFNIEMKFDKRRQRNKGFAFFTVKNQKIANLIVQRNWNIFGRTLQCQFKRGSKKSSDQASQENQRLFISNLSKNISD